MSLASEALLLPLVDEPGEARRLRALEAPARRRRPKLVYAIVALAGAAIIGLVQIVLSIAITQDSFVVSSLTQQNRDLSWQQQAADEQLAGLSSPQALASAAEGLGLVVGGNVNYLRLSDGAVIGSAGPAAWGSTIDPKGAGAVPNALIRNTPPAATTPAPQQGVQPEVGTTPAVDTNVPPAAEGLPTPTIG